MVNYALELDRRGILAGLGATALGPMMPLVAAAQGRRLLTLQARPGFAALRQGQAETPIWSLLQAPDADLRFKRGEQLEITLSNDLPVPIVLNWHGIGGVPSAEPLVVRPPLLARAKDIFVVPLRHAGTFLCDLRLLGDGQARPSSARALIVGETEMVGADRDEAILIEDWRVAPDGNAVAPGGSAKDTMPIYTANGQTLLNITARGHERLRIRFINGCQRNVIALKIEGHEVRVMAIDSQPAESFLARNGQLTLAPGTRIDAFVDATAPAGTNSSILLHDGNEARVIGKLTTSDESPIRSAPLQPAPALPSNGLPARLDLKNALRFEIALGGSESGWVTPASFAAPAAPAFRAKPGRTVVLALTNRGASPIVFHLHGHHFRLLDRLDDGWKPFWLDTLAIDARQTQRIAFSADHAGPWLIESMATDWAAPRLVRWYSVE